MQPHPTNLVGDWDVDDLLFWRALDSHAPLGGMLRQVLANGWTLCIPPDTAIPIGPNREPMPTESFARMHVLVPASSSSSSSSGASVADHRDDGTASSTGTSSTSATPRLGVNNNNNSNTAQQLMSPASSFRARAASFFSSLMDGGDSSKKNVSKQPQQGGGGGATAGYSSNNNAGGGTRSTAAKTASAAKSSTTQPNPSSSSQTPRAVTRYFSGGRKNAIVERRNRASTLDDDDDGSSGGTNNRNISSSSKRGGDSILREVCKKTRFSDDKNSKSLAEADLGVLVTDGAAWGGVRTCARIVFEQKVQTESRKTVTFLVLDRALNAGPSAVPAHLRTFGFPGQGISDAVDFLFDADSEFVSDESSLFTQLQQKTSEARAKLEGELCCGPEEKQQQEDNNNSTNKDDDENDESCTKKQQDNYHHQQQLEVHPVICRARDFVNDLVESESTVWDMAIVHAAHPLSCRRLERSLHIALSCFVHSKVYQVVFDLFLQHSSHADVARWRTVCEKFDSVAGGDDDPVHLGLSVDVWRGICGDDDTIMAAVQRAVDAVGASTNPFDKMQRLEQIVQAVAQQQKLAAEDVVPLLAYYLLRAKRCDKLPVHIAYVRVLADPELILGGVCSSFEYSLATLEFALSVAFSVFERGEEIDAGSCMVESASFAHNNNNNNNNNSGGGNRRKTRAGDDSDDSCDNDDARKRNNTKQQQQQQQQHTPKTLALRPPVVDGIGVTASTSRFEASVIRSTGAL